MKIYLAATWDSRELMQQHAAVLSNLGITITSRWLQAEHIEGPPAQCAQIDLDDIDAADAIMLFSVGPRGTPFTGGGRCIEFGYAIAKQKQLILIGAIESVFHELPAVTQFLKFQGFLESWNASH